jgi:uncharacterized protein (TIGR00251 family)
MKAHSIDPCVTLSVRVTPRSARSEIAGIEDGLWKVRLAAPPVDGAANTELVKLLAKSLGVNKNSVEITSGVASRNKIVRIYGLDDTRLQAFTARFFS